MSLFKIAYIGGASLDEAYRVAGRLNDDKKIIKYISSVAKQKAMEDKTSWTTALATGGIGGGAIGALAGLIGGKKGAMVGAGLGVATGALISSLMKLNDDLEIEEAKRIAGKLTPEQALRIIGEAKRKSVHEDIVTNAEQRAYWDAHYKKTYE